MRERIKQEPTSTLDNNFVRSEKNINERYDLKSKEVGSQFLEFLKEGILIGIPYRIYLRRSNWILPVPGKAPTSFELCVQYPGTYYNRSMSKVFTGQLENENQRRNFWKSAKQKNRESSNAYKKLKREYYKKIGK